jgi:putative DNA primase/helicase
MTSYGENLIRTAFETAEEIEPSCKNSLVAINVEALMLREFQPQEWLIEPLIPTQGITMLFARRGVGKTLAGLSIAWAVATGTSFLSYDCLRPRKVLFVDGEMTGASMKERIAAIVKAKGVQPPDASFFRLITGDCQAPEISLPDISTSQGQLDLEPHLEDVEMLVIDNLATLCRSGKENDQEGWLPVQQWLLRLRRRGISTLIVHHAGKAGEQRGTSGREDICDVVLRLKHPSDYRAEEGCRFEIVFDKSRQACGDAVQSIEAIFGNDGWGHKTVAHSNFERVIALHLGGVEQRDIPDEVGLSKGQVSKLLKRARDEGRFS